MCVQTKCHREQALAAYRYKGLPGLQALYRAFPHANWYIMIGALLQLSCQTSL